MAGTKWIGDLKAITPVTDAARRVLTLRLESVRACLPLAVHEAAKDTEHVHQLRVGTRRAGAALDIFSGCLPRKAYRTAKRGLRSLRRAAGAARDSDVFLLHLAGWSSQQRPRHGPGIDFVIGYVMAQREAAQDQLAEAGQDFPFAFDRLQAETVAAVHRPPAGLNMLVDLARPLLGGLLRELDEAAARNLEDYEHLHHARIVGKRLRYAMEVFGDCFGAGFRNELYATVEEMQEILGRANDSFVACQWLQGLRERLRGAVPTQWKRLRPGIEGLLHFHEQQLPHKRDQFRAWLQQWQAEGGEAALASLKPVAVPAPAADRAPPAAA